MLTAKNKAADRIDVLMEKASAALAKTDYFECEALSQQALELALRAADWSRMKRILMPLEEARRQKRLIAADAGVAARLDRVPEVDAALKPGCWLVEPMLTGADGRELRCQADEQRIPILLITREPETQRGEWPVVVVGPATVRAYVDPPKGRLSVAWFLAASEALGDSAISAVNPDAPAVNRVHALFESLCSVRQHDKLHQALAAACDDAIRQTKDAGEPHRKAS